MILPAFLSQVPHFWFSVSERVKSEIPCKKHLSLPLVAFAEFQGTFERMGLGLPARNSSQEPELQSWGCGGGCLLDAWDLC